VHTHMQREDSNTKQPPAQPLRRRTPHGQFVVEPVGGQQAVPRGLHLQLCRQLYEQQQQTVC
jgi:hypothetical protein